MFPPKKEWQRGVKMARGLKTNKKERKNFGRAGGYYQYACVRFPVAVATPTWTHTFIYIHISTHTQTHRYMCREHPTQYLNIHAYHKLNRKWGNGAQIRDGSSLFSQDFGLYLFVICRSTHHSVRVLYVCVRVMSFQPPSSQRTSVWAPHSATPQPLLSPLRKGIFRDLARWLCCCHFV